MKRRLGHDDADLAHLRPLQGQVGAQGAQRLGQRRLVTHTDLVEMQAFMLGSAAQVPEVHSRDNDQGRSLDLPIDG